MYTRSKNETLFQNSKFSKEKERERIFAIGKIARTNHSAISLSLHFEKRIFIIS